MNNDNHATRYSSSLHSTASELPFSQLSEIAMENEELALNSYYASSQNVTNNNSNFYRPYDTAIGYNNNDESWSFFNANGVLNASSSVNRNMYINNNPTPDFDTPPVWPQFVEPTYPQYSHFSNVNFWPQLYIPQVASYESHHHDYMRHPFSVDQGVDNINESGYELDAGRLPVDTVPSASTLIAQPSLYPNEISNYPVQQQSQQSQSFPSTSNNVDNVPQLPIRPIPQQAVKNADPAHQCKDCSRSCVSAGGLKRHAKFCRASPANLQTIFASLNRPTEEKDSAPVVVDNSTSSNQYPVNLSSTKDASADFTPINFSTTDLVPPSLSEPANSDGSLGVTEEQPQNTQGSLEAAKPTPKKGNQCVANRKRNCPVCQLVLSSERSLVEHLVLHNVAKPYACATCGSRFSRKFHLTRHIKQRGCDGSPRAEFPCEICKKLFSRKDNLREHMKGHTGQTKPRAKLPCPIASCGKEFQGRTQLQVHLNFHSGLRPYMCEWEGCRKSFRSNAALRKHTRTHNYDRPFHCQQCDARFLVKESLTHHMQSHDTLKPIKSFICNRCGMTFGQQAHLTQHISEDHHLNEMFRCTVCPRTYKRRWRLMHHFKTEHVEGTSAPDHLKDLDRPPLESTTSSGNTEEQTFSCSVCSKNFTSKVTLKAHHLTHVVERPVSCTQCSRAYIRRDCLLRHLRTKHHLTPTEALQTMENMNLENGSLASNTPITESTLTNRSDADSMSSNSSVQSLNNDVQQESTAILDQELLDISLLEGNIIELLTLLVDANALRNFGWPNCSVDLVLQTVLVKCAKEPYSNPSLTTAQRLRANTKMLFSFIVDDQNALENLFARRPVEQVLEQVVQLAKSGGNSDNIVQLPL